MKKLMTWLATIAMSIVPFVGVNALTVSTNYYTYDAGDFVNFWKNSKEEEAKNPAAGVYGMILEDKGTSDRYVKTLLVGVQFDSGTEMFVDSNVKKDAITPDYINTMSEMMDNAKFEVGTADEGNDFIVNYTEDNDYKLRLPTLDEVVSALNAEKDGDTYKVDADQTVTDQGTVSTLAQAFKKVGLNKYSGLLTSTVKDGKVWVVDWKVADGTISDITIKQIDGNRNNQKDPKYAGVPVVWMNKTADCHEKTVDVACYVCPDGSSVWATDGSDSVKSCTKDESKTSEESCTSACYDCNGTYTWSKIGSQDATCKKVDNVTSKSKCVKSPKTGISSHILEFGIIAFICAIVLVVIKRKDLFKSI